MTKVFCDLCGKEMQWSPSTMYKYKLRKPCFEGWQYIEAHPECVNKLCDTVEERRAEEMTGDKLKPCPFCGGRMYISGYLPSRGFVISHSGLRHCHFDAFETDWQTARNFAEVIEAWNRRAE